MSEIIAGVDEAGVCPIAGPVVAAAVILNPKHRVYKLRDSKLLTAQQRESLYVKIKARALAVSVGIASVEEIGQLNIFHATMLAMQRAVQGLSLLPSLVLIDGRSKPKLDLLMQAIVGGDRTVKVISAASIIAKVTRDEMMKNFHHQYPNYNFHKHKGYPTKEHQKYLAQYGPCPIHRRSFAMVKKNQNVIPVDIELRMDDL